MPLRQRM